MLRQSLNSRGATFAGEQTSVFGIGVAFMAFTFVVIALRIYVRAVLLRAWGCDDDIDLKNQILTFGLSIASILAAYYGVGKHYVDVPVEDRIPMLKASLKQCIWATRLLYVLGLGFIKLSLLWFYLRLEARRYMQWLVYSVIFIVLGVSISSFFVDTLSCVPTSKFWDSSKSGHCMSSASQQTFYEVNGILVIVMDILIWSVPIPMLWRVRISLIAVLGVFSVGLLSIAAACVRYNTVLQLADNPDETYVLAASLNWCGIEAYVAVFCGSTPSLYVFAKRYLPRLLGSSYAQKSHTTYPGQSNSKRFSAAFRAASRPIPSESRLGESQDALHDSDGIMLKTDIHWEITDADAIAIADAEGEVGPHHVP
ncbi:uncharacterized protein BO80DRAFT_357571 [Aspergillus ibericus CBS 121593]|uniref:Rhodopsin domain-containing protein n=1 Tax=Aspergillus ibericus CBS 121593 TaxID=1448316 RepID=A0A395GXY0_9EURO|nr:hypothetical protein BO80DRAFT_357571 [Aspergillus ibericus CBS 121593]RAL00210.1 hypothetical protein BO80DRAFT_357571 [Aspergillus ibericus CBS 121593]